MVPEGRLHMRPFQFHLKERWRYPQSLDSLLPWSEAISAHLDWCQDPSNLMTGADLHPKDHSIQLFTDASNEGWGAHLDQTFTKGLWSDREKRLHINVLVLKAVSCPRAKAWDIDALNINWTGLTAYAYPPMAFLQSQSQSWGLTSRSTARVILGQVLSIATCGTRTHRGDSL